MSFGEIAAYIISALIVLLLCRIFFKPLKGVFIMALQSVLGGVGLYAVNFLLAPIGFSVGVNIVSAGVCGLFGLPGLLFLICVKAVYTYM